MICRELYLKKIRPFIGKDIIKVLTGIRRSGKSVMLELIRNELKKKDISEEQFIIFNFESMKNAQYCTDKVLYKEIEKIISTKKNKVYIFFDEIQEVANWEKCVNSLRIDYDCDIYITGSNAKLLSSELATYLGGRYVEFVIYPFSFVEYLESRKLITDNVDRYSEFQTYVDIGGMPFLTNLNKNRYASLQYLNDIYNSVILKDVVRRNNIRDVELLERIITYVMANVGHVFSAGNISRYLKNEKINVAVETVLNYVRACKDAYLLYKVKRQDLIGKRILSTNEKYYLVDHGIREAVYGNNKREMDQLLENVVFIELLRRGYAVTVGRIGEKEIDFVATRENEKLYIQVAYLLASNDTVLREFGAYSHITDNYPKYVLSMDKFDMSRDGIKHCNIIDFLLMEEWK